MDPASFHLPAVATAAVLPLVIGGVWYSPLLFARAWMRATGLTDAQLQGARMGRTFALTFVCSVAMAVLLAAFLGPERTLVFGARAGLAVGLGWVATSLAVIYLFEQRPWRLWCIDAGCQVLTYTAMGAVLGGWR